MATCEAGVAVPLTKATSPCARNAAFTALALVLIASFPAGGRAEMTAVEGLAGEAFLGGATLIDPPAGEAANTHAYLTIVGLFARRMFNALQGPVGTASCESGWRVKRAGALTCAAGRRPSEARCSFAIALRQGVMAAGPPC